MKSIEVAVLNPEVIPSAEKMMVCAARLTQRGHKIKSLDDFMALYRQRRLERSRHARSGREKCREQRAQRDQVCPRHRFSV